MYTIDDNNYVVVLYEQLKKTGPAQKLLYRLRIIAISPPCIVRFIISFKVVILT